MVLCRCVFIEMVEYSFFFVSISANKKVYVAPVTLVDKRRSGLDDDVNTFALFHVARIENYLALYGYIKFLKDGRFVAVGSKFIYIDAKSYDTCIFGAYSSAVRCCSFHSV